MERRLEPQPSRGRGPVTIREVAAAAGVSTATVSHVFSARRPVSPEAHDKVLAVARALGYQPNSAARGLATGRSFVLALHVPFDAGDIVLNPFFAAVLMTISATASAEGYGMILLPADPDQAAAQVDALVHARRIDGVLLLDPVPADELIAMLEAADVPVVCIGRLEGRPDIPHVDGDVRAQIVDALEHLASQGYEQPAFLTVAGAQSFLRDGEAAYRDWCAATDRTPVVAEADALTEEASFRRVLDLDPEAFDSLVCANDILAVSAIRAVEARVGGPAAVGVVGTGDSFYAQNAVPRLTSLATQPIEKGRIAAQMLLQLIDGREPAERHPIVPHQLIVRASTPPRS